MTLNYLPPEGDGVFERTLTISQVIERYLAACVEYYGITYEQAETALLDEAILWRGPFNRYSDYLVYGEYQAWRRVDHAIQEAEDPLEVALELVEDLTYFYEREAEYGESEIERQRRLVRKSGAGLERRPA